jgi:hypothetical protein
MPRWRPTWGQQVVWPDHPLEGLMIEENFVASILDEPCGKRPDRSSAEERIESRSYLAHGSRAY